MPEYNFQVEPAQDLVHEIDPLLHEGWSTVKDDYPTSRFNPNYAFYVAAQQAGSLRIFTSRAKGKLVGYALVYLIVHPHRADDIVASVETLFIRPSARGAGHAQNFLGYIENELRMIGASWLCCLSRDQRYDRWLAMRGYRPSERVWERSLQWGRH